MSKLPSLTEWQISVHRDEHGLPQIGPCFGHDLPDSLPLGKGWVQACPNRAELKECGQQFDRVVAAYEVAIGHIIQASETVRNLQRRLEGQDGYQCNTWELIIQKLKDSYRAACEKQKSNQHLQDVAYLQGVTHGVSQALDLVQNLVFVLLETRPEIAQAKNQRRIDSEGRDVTDLPGLWSETDKIGNL